VTEHQARARVESFIADFHAAWLRSGSVPMPSFDPFGEGGAADFDPQEWARSQVPPDFASWDRELAELAAHHFVPGARTGFEGCLTGKPSHDPAAERVVRVGVRRTRGEVVTILPDITSDHHYTFRLAAADDGWRIDRIVHTLGVPGTPVLAPAEVVRLAAAVDDSTPAPAADDELARGMTDLFGGRFATEQLGLVATTGLLAAHDFGLVQFDLAPLDRRVPAGSHPVEVARDGSGTNVAMRMVFAGSPVVTRVPARRVGGSHHIGVDAANVAIMDFTEVAASSIASTEEALQDGAGNDAVLVLSGSGARVGMVSSGFGDGTYPAFWGLARDGALVDLVVDFLVAVENITSTVEVPLQHGPVGHPDLASLAFEVTDSGFVHRESGDGTHVLDVEVLDGGGAQVPGREGGALHARGLVERRWQPDDTLPDDAVLRVTVFRGYRHV
jgi:hypothetical protein